jgi:hypothetical protein
VSPIILNENNLYDITPGYVSIGIPLDARFKQELIDGLHGTNYKLLIVPNGIEMHNFRTLRQAERLGVRVVGFGAGPP